MNPVWIIDDDRSIRWVLEKALGARGHPRQVLRLGRRCPGRAGCRTAPQVLVSDIRMPGKSGLTCCARSRSAIPNLPVIIMTAYSDLDSAVAAFQGGAFEYLPKPFDVDQAVELVRRAIDPESAHQMVQPRKPAHGARNPRPGRGHAGSLPRHRPTCRSPMPRC
jgi:two-component system nitrogen regulation response regulator GlnG